MYINKYIYIKIIFFCYRNFFIFIVNKTSQCVNTSRDAYYLFCHQQSSCEYNIIENEMDLIIRSLVVLFSKFGHQKINKTENKLFCKNDHVKGFRKHSYLKYEYESLIF